MAGKREILAILRSLSLRNKAHELKMPELLSYATKYIEKRSVKIPTLRDLATDTGAKMTAILEELAQEGRCNLEYSDDKIASVHFPEFYIALVRKRYEDIEQNAELPFVSEQAMGISIPADHVASIDVKKEFVTILEEKKYEESQLVRLVYPEGLPSILVPSDLLVSALVKLSLARIHRYLSLQKNAFYMVSKLSSVFRSKEQVVKEMINNIVTQRHQTMESLVQPTEFSFSFWTHLANAILKEFKDKTSKLERENTFCHAAYLIGFYAVYFNGLRRKEKESAQAFKTLDRKLHSEPYIFTVSEIAQFTDDKGIPLTNKYSRNELHAFIEKKTRPSEEDAIPNIVRLKTSDKHEYYICREVILPLSVKKTHEASRDLTKQYIETFIDAIDKSKKLPLMKTDQSFLTDIERKVKTDYALLSSLLNYDLLFLLLEELKPSAEVNGEVNRILDTQHRKIIQMDEVLRLSRRELINQARMRLPIWKTIPLLNKLFGFLGNFARGQNVTKRGKKKNRSGVVPSSYSPARTEEVSTTSSTKVLGDDADTASSDGASSDKRKKSSGAEALKKAMAKLKVEYVGDSNLSNSMKDLAEKWNPLVAQSANADLIEDVQSLIRDFLRKLKKSFLVRPPDAARIRTMAESLSMNKALDQIKRKDELIRYVELYMIKVLGGK